MQPQLEYAPGSRFGCDAMAKLQPLKKFNPRRGLGVVQTVRNDIAANWSGAGDWPLEPGRTGGEFDYREWNLRLAGHGVGAARETQCRGRADCGGRDGRDHGLLCRSGLAIL